jgi:hypothetical protein
LAQSTCCKSVPVRKEAEQDVQRADVTLAEHIRLAHGYFDNAIEDLGRVVDRLRQIGIRGFLAENTNDRDFARSARSVDEAARAITATKANKTARAGMATSAPKRQRAGSPTAAGKPTRASTSKTARRQGGGHR